MRLPDFLRKVEVMTTGGVERENTLLLAAGLLSVTARAQQTPVLPMPAGNAPAAANTEPRKLITAAEIADRISQFQAGAKPGTDPGIPLLWPGPFRAQMGIYTEAKKWFEVHEANAQLIVILDGSGTYTMGGALVKPTRRGTNLNSPTVEGATPHKVVKRDWILVPENTPHAVTQVDGALALMSLHLPPPAPAPEPAPARWAR